MLLELMLLELLVRIVRFDVFSLSKMRDWDPPTVAVVLLLGFTQSPFILAFAISTSIATTNLKATLIEDGRAKDNIKATPLHNMEL